MSKKNKTTIKDVAKEAGVSIATVSYVINGVKKVTEETRKKVNDVIEKLQYEPNILARSLVKKESRAIAVIIPVKEKNKKSVLTDNPFYQEFISGVEYRCRDFRYNTLIIGVDNEIDFMKLLGNGNLAGLVVLGYLGMYKYKLLSNISLPVVVIDQKKISNNFIYMITEDEKGAFLAVEYLIKRGHINIGLLTGDVKNSIVHKARYEGYKSALLKYNIKLREDLIFKSSIDYDGGIKAAEFIKDKIGDMTAVFCIADIIALGLIKGLYKNDIHVPEDISVVGFDNIKNCRYFIPELTTVGQNIFNKGEKAIELIVSRLNKEELLKDNEYIVPVSLIERESVKDI